MPERGRAALRRASKKLDRRVNRFRWLDGLPETAAGAGDYSVLFLRRSTMTPKNRIASTAQTMRTIPLSIATLSFPAGSFESARKPV